MELPAVSALSVMCMLILQMSLTVSSRLLSDQMQIYKKFCTKHHIFVPEKKAAQSDEYKNVLKESAAICGGTVKKK